MRMAETRGRLLALASPGLAVLGLFFLLPLGAVLIEATREGAIARFFADGGLLDALWRSVLLGIAAAVVAVVVAVPVALHMARMAPRTRALIQVWVALPLTFSGLIVAYGFILVLGRAGFVTLLLARLGADPAVVASFLYGPAGLVLAYVYYLSPRVVLVPGARGYSGAADRTDRLWSLLPGLGRRGRHLWDGAGPGRDPDQHPAAPALRHGVRRGHGFRAGRGNLARAACRLLAHHDRRRDRVGPY